MVAEAALGQVFFKTSVSLAALSIIHNLGLMQQTK
jgi:hypothetical protein